MHRSQTNEIANKMPTVDLSGVEMSVAECEYLIRVLERETNRLQESGEPAGLLVEKLSMEFEIAMECAADPSSAAQA